MHKLDRTNHRPSTLRLSLRLNHGFTIVELLIVIVIIAILATITIVAYNGITNRAHESSLKSDLTNGSKLLEIAKTINGTYPADLTTVNNGQAFKSSGDNTPVYNTNAAGDTYCLETHYPTTSPTMAYFVTNLDTSPQLGTCTGTTGNPGGVPSGGGGGAIADGSPIQTITDANCPTTRTRAVDARDTHAYWVQKLADGKCWMLTNLGYSGNGTTTYGDTKALTKGTETGAASYTVATYYDIRDKTPSTPVLTTEPASPSTLTNGTGQYGYLYNWCAAMGAQLGTSTCSSSTSTDNWDHNISICPKNWRLPTGNNAELKALNDAVNSGKTNTDAGLITNPWLGQRSGNWSSGFYNQGTLGYYWSSTQFSATSAYGLVFVSSSVGPAFYLNKLNGFAVRCVAT